MADEPTSGVPTPTALPAASAGTPGVSSTPVVPPPSTNRLPLIFGVVGLIVVLGAVGWFWSRSRSSSISQPATGGTPVSTKTYRSTTYGFSLAYPATWSVHEVAGTGSHVLQTILMTTGPDLTSGGIMIAVGPQNGQATVTPSVSGAQSLTVGGRPATFVPTGPAGTGTYVVSGPAYRYSLSLSGSATTASTAALAAAVQSFQLLK